MRKKRSWRELSESRATVFALMFFVMAILVLPLLWVSPVFTKKEKWLWSVVVVLYTIALFAGAGMVLYWCWQQIRSTFSATY